MPGESMENWDQRAKYVEGAFKLLVDAGWSIHQPGINQLTPLALLEAARQLANQLVNSRCSLHTQSQSPSLIMLTILKAPCQVACQLLSSQSSPPTPFLFPEPPLIPCVHGSCLSAGDCTSLEAIS